MRIPRRYAGHAALAGALAVAVVVPSGLVSGSTAAAPRTPAGSADVSSVSATGVGSVPVRPDVARMHVQVLRDAPTVAQAVDRTAHSVRRVAAVLAAAGVPAADMQMWDIGVNRTGRGFAFYGSREYTVTLRDVERAKHTAADVEAVAGTRVRQFSYEVSEPARYAPEARAAAVADARAAAGRQAAEQGRRLGAVRTVTQDEDAEVSFRWAGSREGEPTASAGDWGIPPVPSDMTVSLRTTLVWDTVPLLGGPAPDAVGRVTVTGFGIAQTEPEYVRTYFSLRGWGTTEAAARRNAAPAIARLRESLRASGIADRDVDVDPVRMLDTYSKRHKAEGWTAYCGFEVKVRDLARAAEIVDAASWAVGDPTRLLRWDYGAADRARLLPEAERAAHAAADAAARHYAELLGRTVGDVEAVRTVPRGGIRPDADATAASHRLVVTRELA
jgi:uncharacterized protein YggE